MKRPIESRTARIVGALGVVFALGGCNAVGDFPEFAGEIGAADAAADLTDMSLDTSTDVADVADAADRAGDAGADLSDMADGCGEFRAPVSGNVRRISRRSLMADSIDSFAVVDAPAGGTERLTWMITGDGLVEARQLTELISEGPVNLLDLGIPSPGAIALGRGQFDVKLIATSLDSSGCWSLFEASIGPNDWQNIDVGVATGCEVLPHPFVAVAGGYNDRENFEREHFLVWVEPSTNTIVSRDEDGASMSAPLGNIVPSGAVDVIQTTGDLVFFRDSADQIFAWDAHQPDVSRLLIATGEPPFAIDAELQRSSQHFDVVHLEENTYLFLRSGASSLEIVEAEYESGALNMVRTTPLGVAEPRWGTLAIAPDYVVVSYFETYSVNTSGRAYRLAHWNAENGLEWFGEPYESFSDPSTLVGVDAVAYRDGCDLVVGVLEVSRNAGRSYEVHYPGWTNAYERRREP